MSLGNGSGDFYNNVLSKQYSILPNQMVASTEFGTNQINFYSKQVGGKKRVTRRRRRRVKRRRNTRNAKK